MRIARQEQLELGPDHWEVLNALQEYFARQEGAVIRRRALHDALEEKFHYKGGVKYLYTLFPRGPVAQGCRIAGLKSPSGAFDPSYGSVS